MDYALQQFISDSAISQPRNGHRITTHNKTYLVKCHYGSFSVPFMNVTCKETGFDKTINLNHEHYNRMVEAIIADYNNQPIEETMTQQMINQITPTHPDYDNELALSLAKDWKQTDEKWLFVTDYFALYNSEERIVNMIEDKFEKILKDNETIIDENAESWLWLCNQ